jgi:hypothetical protein
MKIRENLVLLLFLVGSYPIFLLKKINLSVMPFLKILLNTKQHATDNQKNRIKRSPRDSETGAGE